MFRLTIDSETTGLPYKYDGKLANPEYFYFYSPSRIVQLSWILSYGNRIVAVRDYYIYNPEIKITNSWIHGITDEKCRKDGVDIEIVFRQLEQDLKYTKMILGYNIEFDINVLKAELYRFNTKYLSLIHQIVKTEQFCLMKFVDKYYNLRRWIKLVYLYERLFSVKYPNAHSSLYDVLATFQCFIWIIYNENILI